MSLPAAVCPIPSMLCGRPFRRADGLASGLGASTFRSGRLRRVFRDAYVCAHVPDDVRTRARAALVVAPAGAAVTATTALRLRGVEVDDDVVHLVASAVGPARLAGVVLHRAASPPAAVDDVVTVEEAWLAACARLDLVEAVVVGDQLLGLGLSDRDRLAAAVADAPGRRGRRTALASLPLLTPRSASPQESRSRLLLVLAGLPAPECNVDVLGPDGRFLGRGDLVWRAWRTVAEYDGRQHAESPRQWNRDVDRVDDFLDHGWRFERITQARLRSPRRVVRRVHAALVAGGYTGPAPVFDARWCRLFER